MSAPAGTDYLLLSRGHWDPTLPPERIQQAIDGFYRWYEAGLAEGRLKPGSRLQHEGRVVQAAGIQALLDGPFAEAKELIGGYWFIVASNLDEAAAIAAENPCVACGLSFEIRPLEADRASAWADSNEQPPR